MCCFKGKNIEINRFLWYIKKIGFLLFSYGVLFRSICGFERFFYIEKDIQKINFKIVRKRYDREKIIISKKSPVSNDYYEDNELLFFPIIDSLYIALWHDQISFKSALPFLRKKLFSDFLFFTIYSKTKVDKDLKLAGSTYLISTNIPSNWWSWYPSGADSLCLSSYGLDIIQKN